MSLLEPQLREIASDVITKHVANTIAEIDTLDLIDLHTDMVDAMAAEHGQQGLTDSDKERLAILIDTATASVDVHFTEGNNE